MDNDSKFEILEKVMGKANTMKTTRFWAIWLIAFIVAIGWAFSPVITKLAESLLG